MFAWSASSSFTAIRELISKSPTLAHPRTQHLYHLNNGLLYSILQLVSHVLPIQVSDVSYFLVEYV